ncbi:hypothetical protein B0H17DRAFT_1274491 [Mycena rosella]|uniref:Uncharacterized protein n=1 Tax=Mycena rosella TaxID=1033263 RepID=A0AAD7CCQ8_MYCRO|nr:hypothetical protein B0H17DRAFT_1274491 [Mycena rosella]
MNEDTPERNTKRTCSDPSPTTQTRGGKDITKPNSMRLGLMVVFATRLDVPPGAVWRTRCGFRTHRKAMFGTGVPGLSNGDREKYQQGTLLKYRSFINEAEEGAREYKTNRPSAGRLMDLREHGVSRSKWEASLRPIARLQLRKHRIRGNAQRNERTSPARRRAASREAHKGYTYEISICHRRERNKETDYKTAMREFSEEAEITQHDGRQPLRGEVGRLEFGAGSEDQFRSRRRAQASFFVDEQKSQAEYAHKAGGRERGPGSG